MWLTALSAHPKKQVLLQLGKTCKLAERRLGAPPRRRVVSLVVSPLALSTPFRHSATLCVSVLWHSDGQVDDKVLASFSGMGLFYDGRHDGLVMLFLGKAVETFGPLTLVFWSWFFFHDRRLWARTTFRECTERERSGATSDVEFEIPSCLAITGSDPTFSRTNTSWNDVTSTRLGTSLSTEEFGQPRKTSYPSSPTEDSAPRIYLCSSKARRGELGGWCHATAEVVQCVCGRVSDKDLRIGCGSSSTRW